MSKEKIIAAIFVVVIVIFGGLFVLGSDSG